MRSFDSTQKQRTCIQLRALLAMFQLRKKYKRVLFSIYVLCLMTFSLISSKADLVCHKGMCPWVWFSLAKYVVCGFEPCHPLIGILFLLLISFPWYFGLLSILVIFSNEVENLHYFLLCVFLIKGVGYIVFFFIYQIFSFVEYVDFICFEYTFWQSFLLLSLNFCIFSLSFIFLCRRGFWQGRPLILFALLGIFAMLEKTEETFLPSKAFFSLCCSWSVFSPMLLALCVPKL